MESVKGEGAVKSVRGGGAVESVKGGPSEFKNHRRKCATTKSTLNPYPATLPCLLPHHLSVAKECRRVRELDMVQVGPDHGLCVALIHELEVRHDVQL